MYDQQKRKVSPPAPTTDRDVGLDEWDDIVADKYKVPRSLMKSMAAQESGGDVNAKSPTGVRGKYQVTESTAKQYGLDRNDPFQQSVAAAKHLRAQYDSLKHLKSDDERWLGAVGRYYGGGDAVQGDSLSSRSVDGLSNPAEHVKRVAMKWGEARKAETARPLSTSVSRGIPKTYMGMETDPAKQAADKGNWGRSYGVNYPPDPNERDISKPIPGKPSPRVSKNPSPGVFAQQPKTATANPFDFRTDPTQQNVQAAEKIKRRVGPIDPRLQAESDRYHAQSYPVQVAEDITKGLAGGGRIAQEYGQRVIGAGAGLLRSAATGGRVAPSVVDIRSERGKRNQEQTARTLEDEKRAAGSPILRDVAEAVPGAAGAVLASSAGGVPALLGYNVGAEDWQDPTRSAVRSIANTVIPIAGAKVAGRFAAPVIGGIANPVARTAASAGTEAVGGGLTNAAQTAAEQQIFDGRIDPNAVIRSGVVGAALGGGMAAAQGPTPSRRAAIERPNIEQMATRAQDRPGQQGTTITNMQGRGLPTPAERLGQIQPANVEGAPGLRMRPQGGGAAQRVREVNPPQAGEQAPQVEAPQPQAPADFRTVADGAKMDATAAEQSGNFEAAAAQWDAARQSLTRLRRSSAKTNTPQGLADLDAEINLANQNKVRATNAGRAAARSGTKLSSKQPQSVEAPRVRLDKNADSLAAENAPTADLTEPLQPLVTDDQIARKTSQPLSAQPEKVETTVGQSEPVDFNRLAERQNEQMANAPKARGAADTEDLTVAGLVKRRTSNQGFKVSDKGEARVLSGKEGNLVGLTNRRSPHTIEDVATELHASGRTLDDGQPFLDEGGRVVATEAQVLDYLAQHGKEKVGGTKSLNERVAQEEADYEANRLVTAEFQPDSGMLRDVAEYGRTPEPDAPPIGRRQIRPPAPPQPRIVGNRPTPTDVNMSAAFPRARRAMAEAGKPVQEEIAAGRGKLGTHGKAAEAMFKSSSGKALHGQDSFFHDPQLKGKLGLTRDAEMGEVKSALTKQLSRLMRIKPGQEVSLTQVTPEVWRQFAAVKNLGPDARAKMELAIQRGSGETNGSTKTGVPEADVSGRGANRGSEAVLPADPESAPRATNARAERPAQPVRESSANEKNVAKDAAGVEADRGGAAVKAGEIAVKEGQNSFAIEGDNVKYATASYGRPGRRPAIIDSVYVNKERQGTGSRIVERMIQHLRERGETEVASTVQTSAGQALMKAMVRRGILREKEIRNIPGVASDSQVYEILAKDQSKPSRTRDNPAINGKPVIATTKDGRVIVPNENNQSGVSVVKDQGAKGGTIESRIANLDPSLDDSALTVYVIGEIKSGKSHRVVKQFIQDQYLKPTGKTLADFPNTEIHLDPRSKDIEGISLARAEQGKRAFEQRLKDQGLWDEYQAAAKAAESAPKTESPIEKSGTDKPIHHMTRAEWGQLPEIDRKQNDHELAVIKALRAGEDVPSDVLSSYPAAAKRYGAKPPAPIEKGASVTWKANGEEQAGIVDNVRGDYATVERADGKRETIAVKRFSFGSLKDEPSGPVAGVGLGSLQDAFKRKPKADAMFPPIGDELKRTAPPPKGLGTIRLEGKGRVESGELPKLPAAGKQFGRAKTVSAAEYLDTQLNAPAKAAKTDGERAEQSAKSYAQGVLRTVGRLSQKDAISQERQSALVEASDGLLKASRSGDAAKIKEAKKQLQAAALRAEAEPDSGRDSKARDYFTSPLSNLNFKGGYERAAGQVGKEVSEAFSQAQFKISQDQDSAPEAMGELRRKVAPLQEELRLNGKPGVADMIDDHLRAISGRTTPFKKTLDTIKAINYFSLLRFNPRSAVINALQPIQTLWPHLKTTELAALYSKAYFSNATRQRIGDVSATESGSQIEGTGKPGRFAKVDLFRIPSEANRRMGHLAGEMFADRIGLVGEEKARMAADWAKKVEFDNSKYNIPPLFRGDIASTVGQFKPFLMKNLERLGADWKRAASETDRGSYRFINPSGNLARRSKMIAGQLALGGVRSMIPGLKHLGGVIALGALAKAFQSFGMDEEWANKFAEAAYFGAPALVGTDFSGSMMVLDEPFGNTAAEQMVNLFLGPTASRAMDLGVQGYAAISPDGKTKATRGEQRTRALQKIGKNVIPKPLYRVGETGIAAYKGKTPTMQFDKEAVPMTLPEAIAHPLGGTPVRQTEYYQQKDAYEWQKNAQKKMGIIPRPGNAKKPGARR